MLSLRDELRNLPAHPRDLRKFGLLVGGVFALVGAWLWWRGHPAYAYLLIAGFPLMFFALAWPSSLKAVYFAWMALGLCLGLIVSTLLLTLVFYLVVTPLGLLARLTGKDFMKRRWQPEASSYWTLRAKRVRPPRDYEQQF
jgi:polyferredoxin